MSVSHSLSLPTQKQTQEQQVREVRLDVCAVWRVYGSRKKNAAGSTQGEPQTENGFGGPAPTRESVRPQEGLRLRASHTDGAAAKAPTAKLQVLP